MRVQFNPLIAVVFVLLTGCGNAKDPYTPPGPHPACVDGFVNETILPTGQADDPPHVGEWLPNGRHYVMGLVARSPDGPLNEPNRVPGQAHHTAAAASRHRTAKLSVCRLGSQYASGWWIQLR